jgi:CheY-like chemotaxis protein
LQVGVRSRRFLGAIKLSKRKLQLFLIEDDNLTGMVLEEMLATLGHEVVARARSYKDALAAARRTKVDLVLLDVNLGGESAFPIADVLAKRRIPFIFLTGYGTAGIKQRYPGVPALGKPFDASSLSEVIDGI